MSKLIYLFLITTIFHIDTIRAEIQEMTLSWTALACQSSCVQGLYGQFQRIPGVDSVSINQNAGQAAFRWKQNVPFSYRDVKTAMQLIGLAINNIKLRVRGTIVQDSPTSFRLISAGDKSGFTLISIAAPTTNQYVEQFNAQNRGLSPTLIAQLQGAMAKNQTVVVYGPLFTPWRAPPLFLVVEGINIEDQ